MVQWSHETGPPHPHQRHLYRPDPQARRRQSHLPLAQHLLGNLKTSLRGTFHAIAPRYVPRYLAQPNAASIDATASTKSLPRLADAAIRTTPCPYRSLVKAEFPA